MAQSDEPRNETENEPETYTANSWEFLDTAPATETVVRYLSELPNRWGLKFDEYVDFVQPLPQNKKMPRPPGADRKTPDVYKTAYTLYFSVGGRIAMLNDLADVNDWRVDFVPEPTTPTGIPGYLVKDDTYIVYREYVEIWQRKGDGGEVLLGRKPGTASVPASGGSGAVASSRFEKVETSARGRALGAWGIGVLPGSGVASLEEMQEAMRPRPVPQPEEQAGPKMSREEILERLRIVLVEYGQVADISMNEVLEQIQEYAKKSFAKEVPVVDGVPDFSALKDGELTIMGRAINKKAAGIQVQKERI